MRSPLLSRVLCPGVLAGILLYGAPGCSDHAAELSRQRSRERAEAQVERIANDLDGRTTETGVYVRVKEGDIKETDPWGTRIEVGYSQGGIAEMVEVRSAGPDRELNTRDDIVADRIAANLKGVGEGIKKNADETASRAARGAVKGAIQGVKESIAELAERKTEKQGGDASRDAAVEKK